MPRFRLTAPPRLPLVAPSILSADFANLERDCRAVLDLGADLLHLDVMDGHFVPNLTMGPALCAALRKALPDVVLDVHLMVVDPAAYVEPFAKAGADHLTVHVEADLARAGGARAIAERIRGAGMTAGIAVNPPTPVDAVAAEADAFDLLLVMSVNPGFSGQSFIAEVLPKVSALRARMRPDQRLEMDGGVGPANAAECRARGCDLLVAASAIFGAADRRAAIDRIRGAAMPGPAGVGSAR